MAQLDALPQLKAFPAVATQVLTACEDDQTSAKDLVEIIRCDPTLSVQLLRLANSSAYGFTGRIKSVEHAAIVLGFRNVKTLVVSVAAAGIFAEGETAVMERKLLWQHSLACATVAKLLAADLPEVGADEAFIAGIVHDVGRLVFLDLASNCYHYSPQGAESRPTTADERRDFGIDHGSVGSRCGEEWGLPDEINEAIHQHHSPEHAELGGELISVIYAANQLAKSWGLGTPAVGGDEQLDEWLEDGPLSLTPDRVDELRRAAPAEFAELAEAFTP
jgi:putative nucleotidyltransferase with HDIG domain